MAPSEISILTTKDYSIFKNQEGNRNLAVNDIKRIEKKIMDNNLLKYHPILIGKDFKVIDGQHRLEVARKNNLEISFIIMQSKASLKTTQSVNTTGKPWQVRDFLKSYIALRNPLYMKFNNYLQRYNFLTISQLIEISVMGRQESRSANDTFREGTIVLRDDDIIIKILNDINNYIGSSSKISKNTYFQRFIVQCNRRGIIFDHKRMAIKIEANSDIIKRIANDTIIYSEVLGDIYNHKLAKSNKVNFNLRIIK